MRRIFFTDRDLGKTFPEILRETGVAVERHADHFAHDCPDVDWLRDVGKRGWTVITHDRRIRYKPNERAAVIEHQVGLLVVVGKATHADLARSFVATLPVIERFLDRHQPPFIAKVFRPPPSARRRKPVGRVELWLR